MKKIGILFMALAMIFVFTGTVCAGLNDGLVAYYPFNGNANDVSGNGHHGTVVGPSLTVDRANNSASAYSFDGEDDYIDIPYSPSIEPSVFSLSIWFKTSTSNQGALWSTDPNMYYCKHGYMIVISGNNSNSTLPVVPNGTPLFTIDPSTACSGYGPTIRGDYPLNDGKWHHMVAIYNGSSMKMYVDGVLQDETKNTIYRKTGASIRVGMNRRTSNHPEWRWFYEGSIDDIRLYSRVLSDSEIQQLYLKGDENQTAEIIGIWDDGTYYFYKDGSNWRRVRLGNKPDAESPSGDIEAGDTNSDGYADVASCWSSGLYLQDGRTRDWEFLYAEAPYKVTMANVYGDARKEVIGTWENGVFYFYRTSSGWNVKQITGYPPAGDMTACDITGDGWDEVVSGYSTGTWIWYPKTGGWQQITSETYIPYSLACGDRNGDGRAEVVGTFHTGIWAWDRGRWSRLTDEGFATKGDMEMGDFNKNGRDDLVSCWPDGMWIQYDNGTWDKPYNIAPYRVTTGNIVDN